ncbi:flagellar hook-associated protein FlgK [Pelomonas sp. KK5]|uniref:flagellar hook-associated protein FlgK n=1 Tax=Pelomonas sp. KK5 TaxID=1855730 RepID=UPI00097BDC5C|nr:flagellar hook-associated protein FlgK [Pelomonas sp. KK5]
MTNILSIGKQAMFANQAALQTIGQNIANANTPGYSRQQVILTTPQGQFTGSGYFGAGVNVQTVERAHNAFMTSEAASTKAIASMDSTRVDQMTQLQKLFATDDSSLGAAASTFFNSLIDVSNNPSDPSARQVVLSNAQNLATRFATAGQQLQDLQAGVVSDMKADVATVNQLAQQIATANAQISAAHGTGHEPNDLLDKRDQLINQLSQYVQVSTLQADDGSMGVFIGGGQRLVLGNQAQQLSVEADPYDSNRATLNIIEANGPRKLDESVLTGGSLTARLMYQNQDLQDARNMIGQLATAVSAAVNKQQGLGLDLSNPPGTGAAMFSVGPPTSLPASTNARNPDGSFSGGVQLTVTDATQLQATSYTLRGDPANPGAYLLTRGSDGQQTSVTDGSIVDGFQISFTPGPPADGDSYRLEPVANAAVGMKRQLDSINGIAAAAPVTGDVSVNNTGTASIDSLYAVNSNLNPSTQAPMTVTFTGANASNGANMDYTITLADGSTLNGTWQAGTPIGNQPAAGIDLGFEMNLNGVPRAGDTITIEATKYTAANNGNAKAFLNLQNQKVVGGQVLSNGTTVPGATINDAYTTAMSDIGARLQGANYLSGVSTSSAQDAETARSGQAGVNLDEEAARLMQFQQGYQAAAKILQTAQILFNETLKLAGN